MLNNSLYTIKSFENPEGKVAAIIELDVTHPVFDGHFPGQPVLPGVCMIQLVKELTEKATARKLFLKEVANSKFLSMIDPRQTPVLMIAIDYSATSGAIGVTAVLKADTTAFFKMTAKMEVL